MAATHNVPALVPRQPGCIRLTKNQHITPHISTVRRENRQLNSRVSSLFHKPNHNACLRHSPQSIRGDLVPLRSVAAAKSRHWHLQRALPSPLSLPWPEVAALTTWYKTYQEVFRGRSWIDVLQELHGKYGMRHASFRS